MPSDIGKSRFRLIAERVEQQTRFYDRKSKHLRFDGDQIFLHRGFDGRSATARQKRAEQRSSSGAAIFEAIRQDYDEATAERIFMAVTRSPLAQQSLSLGDFEKIAKEVEALGPARTDAVLNGTAQEVPIGGGLRQDIAADINGSVIARQNDPQALEWRSTNSAQEDLRRNLAGSMLKELGKAEISLNGVAISSRDEAAHAGRSRLPRADDLPLLVSRTEDLAGVPLEDMRTLSLVLNRGLLYTALHQVNRQAAIAFSPQPGTPQLDIRCNALPGQPGRYHFTARLRQPLSFVTDPQDPAVADRLDPARSRYEIALSGIVDCGAADAPVALDDARMAYAGVVQT